MEHLRISTMTQVASLSTHISLKDLYEGVTPNPKISYLGFGHECKGDLKTSTKKQKAKEKEKDTVKPKRRYFFNQVTLHIVLDKTINMKVFNNGGIQMTGLKSSEQGHRAIETFISEIVKLTTCASIFLDTSVPVRTMSKLVMINSDFDIGCEINREVLHREIIGAGYYSSYDPGIYPGVNMKYYFNPSQSDGVCRCQGMCDGKGHNGYCKKITIAIFKSGKIIITGGQTMQHIHIAYTFITRFIRERQELIEIG